MTLIRPVLTATATKANSIASMMAESAAMTLRRRCVLRRIGVRVRFMISSSEGLSGLGSYNVQVLLNQRGASVAENKTVRKGEVIREACHVFHTKVDLQFEHGQIVSGVI